MNANDSFERSVRGWLLADAEHQVPDHLEAVLQRTRTERQRPAWSSLERWLPMDTTLSARAAPALRPVWIVLILGLLLIALVAAVILAGSRSRTLPPFGLAANGEIFYALNGDIYAADPDGTDPRVLVGDREADFAVVASRDGTRIAFARALGGAQFELQIADADGGNVRDITSTPLVGVPLIAWSPDGTRLAVADASTSTLSIVHADGSERHDIDVDLEADQVFWRPNGDELIFRGYPLYAEELVGFHLVRADGTGYREILLLNPANGGDAAVLSPDGNQIMYTQWDGDGYPGGHLYVLDVATGDKRLLEFDGDEESDYFADWSPDGSRIVFNQGTAQQQYFVAVAPAEGGHATRLGPVMPWNAAAIAAFSPDGTKVMARYADGKIWIFDLAGGPGSQLEAGTLLPSWQRLAPDSLNEPCPGGGC